MNFMMLEERAYELQYQNVKWEEFRILANSDFLKLAYGLCDFMNTLNGAVSFVNKLSLELQECRARCKQNETKNNDIGKDEMVKMMEKPCLERIESVTEISPKVTEISPKGRLGSVQAIKRKSPSKLSTPAPKKNRSHQSPRNKHLGKDEPTQFDYADIKTEITSPKMENSLLSNTDKAYPSSPILLSKSNHSNKSEDDLFKSPLRKIINGPGIKSLREEKPLQELNNKPFSITTLLKTGDEKYSKTKVGHIVSNELKLKENSNVKTTKRYSPEIVKMPKMKTGKKLVQTVLNVGPIQSAPIKSKKSQDLSKNDVYDGGQRTKIKREVLNDDCQLNEAIQRSLTDQKRLSSIDTEDDEIIAASPVISYRKLSPHQPQKSNLVIEEMQDNKLDCTVHQLLDHDETILIDRAHPETVKKPFGKICTKNDVKNDSISLLPSSKGNKKYSPLTTITSNKSNEFIYKEATVRKVAEKKKLPGWVCKDCKDYCEAAYHDDPGLLEVMLNKCSKHRGKFNPEKEHTPPRYWEVGFSPTQNDE